MQLIKDILTALKVVRGFRTLPLQDNAIEYFSEFNQKQQEVIFDTLIETAKMFRVNVYKGSRFDVSALQRNLHELAGMELLINFLKVKQEELNNERR